MSYHKCLLVIFFTTFCFCSASHGQGLKDKLRGKMKGGGAVESDRDNQRVDFEGAVWEYKIIDSKEKDKSKQTRMIGRIRIKQNAVFAVGGVEVIESQPELTPSEQAAKYINQFDKDGDDRLDTTELTKLLKSMQSNQSTITSTTGSGKSKPLSGDSADGSTGLKGDFKSLLSQRVNSAKEEGTGSDRIGDLSKNDTKESVFTFDQDDSYPLSGRAELRPDKYKKGGVWIGSYDEYVNGKKQHRWRIEMRKIDE